jgi:hypothetical protein
LQEGDKEDGMFLRTGVGTGNKRGIIRSHSVKNCIWKGLWTIRKRENRVMMMMIMMTTKMMMVMMMMMMLDGDGC